MINGSAGCEFKPPDRSKHMMQQQMHADPPVNYSATQPKTQIPEQTTTSKQYSKELTDKQVRKTDSNNARMPLVSQLEQLWTHCTGTLCHTL